MSTLNFVSVLANLKHFVYTKRACLFVIYLRVSCERWISINRVFGAKTEDSKNFQKISDFVIKKSRRESLLYIEVCFFKENQGKQKEKGENSMQQNELYPQYGW